MSEALPCRWCGGKRFVWVSSEDESGTPLDKVGCRECGATGPGCDGRAAAVEAWNSGRAAMPTREAYERGLKGALDGFLEPGDWGSHGAAAEAAYKAGWWGCAAWHERHAGHLTEPVRVGGGREED